MIYVIQSLTSDIYVLYFYKPVTILKIEILIVLLYIMYNNYELNCIIKTGLSIPLCLVFIRLIQHITLDFILEREFSFHVFNVKYRFIS